MAGSDESNHDSGGSTGRRQRRSRVVRVGVVALPALVLLALVGIAVSRDDERVIATVGSDPDQVYELDGLVVERENGTAQLCLGAIRRSIPPQCSGMPVANWTWEGVSNAESLAGTRWAGVHLRGRYDGNQFTLTAAPRPAAPSSSRGDAPKADLRPACEEPEVVDEADRLSRWEEVGPLVTRKLPDLVAAWITEGVGVHGFVANVVVRPGDSGMARRVVRRHFGGPVCIVERNLPTIRQLETLQERVETALGANWFEGFADNRRGVVVATVLIRTSELQKSLDDEFGEGRVELYGLLTPVE